MRSAWSSVRSASRWVGAGLRSRPEDRNPTAKDFKSAAEELDDANGHAVLDEAIGAEPEEYTKQVKACQLHVEKAFRLLESIPHAARMQGWGDAHQPLLDVWDVLQGMQK